MRNKENKLTVLTALLITVISSAAIAAFNIYLGALALLVGIAVNCVYISSIKKRYAQIESLNDYLSMVCSGNYSLDISDNMEGELSILKNNLYKVVVQLQSTNEALTNDKKYLADSLADISHQLKTPLTSMMVMADLVASEDDPSKREEFIQIIGTQLEKMKWLIATLLKLSKLDAGTADMCKTNISISSVIEESLKPFLITIDIKAIQLIESVNDFEFVGDMNWSVEAVQNIIKNCLEHTNDNGILEISTNKANVYNELIIKDNGSGIDKDDLPHIFERFYHGKNSSSDSVGIGLALSKEILSNQNARIEVSSTANKGTEFRIRFYKTVV